MAWNMEEDGGEALKSGAQISARGHILMIRIPRASKIIGRIDEIGSGKTHVFAKTTLNVLRKPASHVW